ncbi:MAG: hypothetical protein H0W08_03770 [Acidobacteria bacterium]|nr:hypothetical protein [Acidobacteriota bacterium]
MRQSNVHLSLTILLACLVGCASNLRVASLQLGRSLNADSTVASHTTRFAPEETVYVSVITAGVGSGTVGVRWMYAGRLMGEPTKTVRGAAATEFHLQSAGGFPLGDYTVEAFLDGQSVGTKSFRVDNQR